MLRAKMNNLLPKGDYLEARVCNFYTFRFLEAEFAACSSTISIQLRSSGLSPTISSMNIIFAR